MTTGAIDIRPATPADANVVARLMTAFNSETGSMGWPWGEDTQPKYALVSVEQAARRVAAMAGLETVFLASRDGSAVGLAALRMVPHLDQDVPYAELTQMFVLPEYRRMGIASILLAHVEAVAAELGCTSVYLLTGHDNIRAQALYRSAGFEPHYVGFDKFIGSRL